MQDGFTIVENRTSDIIQETRKHIKKKPGNSEGQRQETKHSMSRLQPHTRTQMHPQMQADQELQLKASRDVRWQLYITFSCGNCVFDAVLSMLLSLQSNFPNGLYTRIMLTFLP